MNTKEFKDKIEEIENKISSLNKERRELIIDFQNSCPHDEMFVIETEYECFGKWVKTINYPDRICRNCGMKELNENKYNKNSKLWKYKDVPKMKKDDAKKYLIY